MGSVYGYENNNSPSDTISFDDSKMETAIDFYNSSVEKIQNLRESIANEMNKIRAAWTDDNALNLSGREKAFSEINNMLETIENNVMSIRDFLNEKRTGMSSASSSFRNNS